MSLLTLPPSILSTILKYLTIDNVSVLDTASCITSRQNFLNILSTEIIFKDNTVSSSSNLDANRFFLWLEKREVKMKHFNFFHWENITDSDITILGRCCSRLESLDINNMHGCNDITNDGIHWLANGCSRLKKLSLRSCRNVTDVGLSRLAEGCSMLQTLNLSMSTITDVGLSCLAEHCSML